MNKIFIFLSMFLMLCGCNSIYVKPGTMEPESKVFATRGGYSMRRSIKQKLEDRGFGVTVGKATYIDDGEHFSSERANVPADVKYVVRVIERSEWIAPWCVFNGFWWWNFNVSIADQKTGEEIMTWRGRGCAKSSMRKLDRVLDKLVTSN